MYEISREREEEGGGEVCTYPDPFVQVLDEEAEVFVVKLWRLLIYETEAKYLGIAKSY